jgi:hypothetical protein
VNVVGSEIVQKQQWGLAAPAKAPVREADVSLLDELCASGFMRIIVHNHLLLLRTLRYFLIRPGGSGQKHPPSKQPRVD